MIAFCLAALALHSALSAIPGFQLLRDLVRFDALTALVLPRATDDITD